MDIAARVQRIDGTGQPGVQQDRDVDLDRRARHDLRSAHRTHHVYSVQSKAEEVTANNSVKDIGPYPFMVGQLRFILLARSFHLFSAL